MAEFDVVIVGAGPAGLATSACLNRLGVSNVVLEREDCIASLWKRRAYERLKLHLAKPYCHLPHAPLPRHAPTYVPRADFVRYLDAYAARFGVAARLGREVESATYDAAAARWAVAARDPRAGAREAYSARFLVVATGENGRGFVPPVRGLEGFGGKVLHSSCYDNGKGFVGKRVLVVGCGNSGMEIAYDLSNWNAITSIVARSPVHLLSEEIVRVGMFLLKYLPVKVVDTVALMLGRLKHGNMSEYGFQKPKVGPFLLKATTGKSPTIDVGTVNKIKSGQIKVFPSIANIDGNSVIFENGEFHQFDAIIFATGYRSTVKNWLKDGEDLFNEKGMPRQRHPNEYWKGKNGLYCAGFSSRGLFGISEDAQKIAQDIFLKLKI